MTGSGHKDGEEVELQVVSSGSKMVGSNSRCSYSIYCAALLRVGKQGDCNCCFPHFFFQQSEKWHEQSIAKPVLPQREQQQSIAASVIKSGCAKNRGTIHQMPENPNALNRKTM